MTDPSGDKDHPSTSYDPPSTTESSSYDPGSYEPPATADPTFDSTVPDSTIADSTVSDSTATDHTVASGTAAGTTVAGATAPPPYPAAGSLPPGAFETPAAHIPGTPYAAPGYPQQTYAQPYPPAYGAPYAPPAPYAQPYPGAPRTQDNALAIGALVCSILGFCSGITALPGLIMGHIALSRTNRGEGGGRGVATAAVIIGYVVVALWVGFFTTFIILGVNGQFDS
ncbi:DUF4190 domain-containing protein [Amycolatopsis sp. WQ 127309]|uniref:DUF4190 domain-containing protein n=1 Tax=Amycolatopsis sp. WQ 127309 TaxID=2932773 RepID=UPI001FF65E7A|nr:DUF4190 domain-containing protein [Amycolatopsis sp. WQ 127309]UOZ10019.1 DUF4190 domain-containing protein [Amycolatopsis sp. WQ 127309]